MPVTENPQPLQSDAPGWLPGALSTAGQKPRRPGQKPQNVDQDLRNSSLDTQEAEQDLRETQQNLRENNLALVNGEEWFRLLVEGNTDYAVYILDPQGRVVTWNAGAVRSKGYTAEEILGRNYSTFFLPEDAAAGLPERELATAAHDGRFETEEWRRRKDGTKFWALVTTTAIRDAKDELRGFANITRNMNERKAAEEELRKHNAELESYRIIVENVSEYGICTMDTEGRFTSWGAAASKALGYAPEEMLGRHYSILATEEDRLAGLPQMELEEAARAGRSERDSWKYRKDGTLFWGTGTLAALRDESGKLTGFVRVGRDMTKQKLAEEELRKLNAQLERYRIIVENVTDYVIYTLDAEGRINSWSAGSGNVVGFTADQAIGMGYSLGFTPEEIEAGKPQQELEDAERYGSCATDSWRVRRDGSRFWSSGVLTAVWDENRKLAGFIRVARDMTVYKQLEEAQMHLAAELEDRVRERTLQLEANIEKLRCKNAEVEASARIIAHELQEKEILFHEIHHRVKNNLQVVQSLLKMVVRELPQCEAREAVNSMILRVRAMAIVHERLCQMPGLADIQVADYLRDIFKGAISSYSVEPCRIKFDLDAEDIRLNLDRAIPFGLLANELISNCLKHGFPAGRKGKISISIHREDGVVRMVIEDNGIGLPEKFDAANFKSMGLKLANSLAHQLGGNLLFTSKQGCRVEGDFTRL